MSPKGDNNMHKEDIKEWLATTKKSGYIDCDNKFIDDGEFNFIVSMAEELLKRMEE